MTAFDLRFRPPYDWRAMLSFLDARAVGGVEQVDGDSYRRTVRVSHRGREYRGWIDLSIVKRASALRVAASSSLESALAEVSERVKWLMDLSSNPIAVARALGRLAEPNPGLRVPGAFDGFEVGVRAILGQQVTVAAARTFAGRFAAAFGSPLGSPPSASLSVVFPSPEKVAKLKIDQIARLGVIASRARSIVALARAIVDGTIRLEPTADAASEMKKLRALPGIGEWTAQYIAMRALGWRDAFPHTDFGVMKALGETSPRRVLEAGEAWRPWRSYAVMHLWHSLHQ